MDLGFLCDLINSVFGILQQVLDAMWFYLSLAGIPAPNIIDSLPIASVAGCNLTG